MILYKIILQVIKEIIDFHHYSSNFELIFCFVFCFFFLLFFDKNILIWYEIIVTYVKYIYQNFEFLKQNILV